MVGLTLDETRHLCTGGTMYKEFLSKSTLTATLEVQTVAFYINSLRWRYKQLLHKSTPYAGDKNSCFLYQLPTLEVHPYAQGTTLRWWYKQGCFKSTPFAGGTNTETVAFSSKLQSIM